MQILIVSPWLPHPEILHAGGQHLYHTIRSLKARGHAIHLLCYRRDEPEPAIAALRAQCASLTALHPAYTWRDKLAHFVQGGWQRPWTWGRRTHLEARAAIARFCCENSPDVAHFVWTEMGRYLEAVPPGVGMVLGTLDVEYLVRPREVTLFPPGPARWAARRRARALIRAEPGYVRRADVTTACSVADRAYLAALPAAPAVERLWVVPPWADLEAVRNLGLEGAIPGRLTFMGALDRVANQGAVRFLLEGVWPRIRAAQPGATLRIVGAHPPAWLLRRAAADSRLTVTGYVPDLAAEWAATDVAVSPSLIGGGLLTKVAQPLAAGRPVVTTTLGNEGIAAPPGSAVEVADDPAAFAAAVLRLLTDRKHRAQLAAAGRAHVLATLDWERSLDALEDAYAAAACRASKRSVLM